MTDKQEIKHVDDKSARIAKDKQDKIDAAIEKNRLEVKRKNDAALKKAQEEMQKAGDELKEKMEATQIKEQERIRKANELAELEKEARLAPDKVKLSALVVQIDSIQTPEVVSLEARNIVKNTIDLLNKTTNYIREKICDL